jgi:hypothetical protein
LGITIVVTRKAAVFEFTDPQIQVGKVFIQVLQTGIVAVPHHDRSASQVGNRQLKVAQFPFEPSDALLVVHLRI